MFVSDNWVSMSEPLCSMSRFVCIVNLWYVHITPGMASSAVQIYHVLFLPTCVPVILPHFDSFFEQVCPAVRPHLSYAGSGSRRGGLLRFGTVEPPDAMLQFTTYTLLPHSCLLHNLLHLRSCHFLVLSRSVARRCGQGVLSSVGVLSVGVLLLCCM